VVLYNREGVQFGLFELTENLHNEIFNSKQIWRSYLELRRLSDYYLTDETFSGERLSNLITDLNNYKSFISVNKLNEYEEFIKKISRSNIAKVHIAGD
jgi:predicted nucleic acid-binding protein